MVSREKVLFLWYFMHFRHFLLQSESHRFGILRGYAHPPIAKGPNLPQRLCLRQVLLIICRVR
jgi:hypothetical protein